MKMYLSSYELGEKTEVLKQWIKDNDNKILLICNARDYKEQNEREFEKIKQNKEMLENIGFEVTILDLKKYFNNREQLEKDIAKFYAFCVIGGNVFNLRMAMKLSGFDKYLQKIKDDKRYLYVSYSAGSCVLAKSLEGLDLVDEPINPYNDDKVIYEGIGLIDFRIAPHYKSNHKESLLVDKLVEYFEKNNILYKALRDGEVIIIN